MIPVLLGAAAAAAAVVLVAVAYCACIEAGLDDEAHGRGDDIDGPTRVRLLADAGIDAWLDDHGRLHYRGMRNGDDR